MPDNVSLPKLLLTRGDRVLHYEWGMGRVLHPVANSPECVAVEWQDGVREVSTDSLRRLLPRTELARLIERSSPVSAWTVRKADEQGTIQPDVKGRFAGHAVHYYDAARFPALIEQLSRHDQWRIGALVIHSQHGPGRIVASASAVSTRLVQFFASTSPLAIPVRDLRHLISSNLVASRIGVNRKTFARLAARKGIYPDYSSDGRAREFFDEGRVDEIRRRWCAPQQSRSFQPGRSLVLDSAGDVARVESITDDGKALLRFLDEPLALKPAHTYELRQLVSLRELARSQNMSRYKLQRLLTVIGLQPVYQNNRTMYFDVSRARRILQGRLDRENSAVSLQALSRRTGVSPEVLARKIRHECIRTLGQKAAHFVDEQEAQRIEELLAALRSRWAGLPGLGVCRLHQRGRAGYEVFKWDIAELINVAQRFPPKQRPLLFDQVAWFCEGAGRERLRQALDCYLSSLTTGGNASEGRRAAQILLPLLSCLPGGFDSYRIRLLLIVSRGMDICSYVEPYLRTLAGEVGAGRQQRYQRFRTCIDRSFAALFSGPECGDIFSKVTEPPRSAVRAEDDFVPGAVVANFTDNNPNVGVIVRVEQKAWNAVAAGWDKTVVVRFAEGERRINPHTRKANTIGLPNLAVLLRSGEASSLFRAVRQPHAIERAAHQPDYWSVLRAS